MDISFEAVFIAQQPDAAHDPFCGVIRRHFHSRTQEKAFYIIPAVKFNGQARKLPRLKAGSSYVRGTPVGAVFAVKNAIICEQDLEKRNAAPVRGPCMADSRGRRASNLSGVFSPDPAGRARYVEFCAVG
ncbi:hypothetical protein SDC9_182227 [bioreactor metagenome]|uniref:Uncharacterized protein n=1 Tax=bioreactor metagenome TaxID=1076179 RepID=A0A645HGD8_9ZZZZ